MWFYPGPTVSLISTLYQLTCSTSRTEGIKQVPIAKYFDSFYNEWPHLFWCRPNCKKKNVSNINRNTYKVGPGKRPSFPSLPSFHWACFRISRHYYQCHTACYQNISNVKSGSKNAQTSVTRREKKRKKGRQTIGWISREMKKPRDRKRKQKKIRHNHPGRIFCPKSFETVCLLSVDVQNISFAAR